MAPRLEHSKAFLFLSSFPDWQDMVRRRLDEHVESYVLKFVYEDDFHVNDDLVEKALGKMNIDKAEKKLLFAEHMARESLTESGHGQVLLSHSVLSSRHPDHIMGLFEPVRINVRIDFFSDLDYWEFNRAWIVSNWSSLHVQAFLRLIGLSKYERVFYDHEVDGEVLISVIANASETLTGQMNMLTADVDTLKDNIRRLGLLDDTAVLVAVAKEECFVRAEHERGLEVMVSASRKDDKNKSQQRNRGSGGTTASPGRSTAPTGSPQSSTDLNGGRQRYGDFTEGVFEVVMVGDGAVGKTSLLNCICGLNFNPIEKPTIGTKLVQHTLGKLVVEVWDIAGQPTQFGSVKAKTRRADILFAVYDVSNRDSIIVLEQRILEIIREGVQPWTSIVLLGNKADISDQFRQVMVEEGLLFARRHSCSSFFETSAKTGFNVRDAVNNAVLKTEQ
ncbi:Rab26, partial [Symbiodinium microadriaticum]